jgi:hypothetical protein
MAAMMANSLDFAMASRARLDVHWLEIHARRQGRSEENCVEFCQITEAAFSPVRLTIS